MITGILGDLPKSGMLWMAGLIAITGMPPFGLFQSELAIIRAAIDTGHILVAVVLLAALAVIFVAMTYIVMRMAYGPSCDPARDPLVRESMASVIPPAVLGAAVLVMGVYIPPALNELLAEASHMLGGR
jgi:hydrogenase-4 component F